MDTAETGAITVLVITFSVIGVTFSVIGKAVTNGQLRRRVDTVGTPTDLSRPTPITIVAIADMFAVARRSVATPRIRTAPTIATICATPLIVETTQAVPEAAVIAACLRTIPIEIPQLVCVSQAVRARDALIKVAVSWTCETGVAITATDAGTVSAAAVVKRALVEVALVSGSTESALPASRSATVGPLSDVVHATPVVSRRSS